MNDGSYSRPAFLWERGDLTFFDLWLLEEVTYLAMVNKERGGGLYAYCSEQYLAKRLLDSDLPKAVKKISRRIGKLKERKLVRITNRRPDKTGRHQTNLVFPTEAGLSLVTQAKPFLDSIARRSDEERTVDEKCPLFIGDEKRPLLLADEKCPQALKNKKESYAYGHFVSTEEWGRDSVKERREDTKVETLPPPISVALSQQYHLDARSVEIDKLVSTLEQRDPNLFRSFKSTVKEKLRVSVPQPRLVEALRQMTEIQEIRHPMALLEKILSKLSDDEAEAERQRALRDKKK